MGESKKNGRKGRKGGVRLPVSQSYNIGPFEGVIDRCEKFGRGMMTSFYMQSLSDMLTQAELEGELDSLEVRIAIQITTDTLLEEGDYLN